MLEAVGFATINGFAPELVDALYRELPPQGVITPLRIDAAQVIVQKDGYRKAKPIIGWS